MFIFLQMPCLANASPGVGGGETKLNRDDYVMISI